MREVTEFRGKVLPKEEAQVLRLQASENLRQREQERYTRQSRRLGHSPERLSVAKAMLSVERRIVSALWTLARLPNDRGVGFAKQHGVAYFSEYADRVEQGRAAGWMATPPRPSPPTARAIDEMHEPLEWLRMLDRDVARILSEGALSKRGDMARQVAWGRVKRNMPELGGLTIRTLQRRYETALRTIVAELTLARLG